MSHKYSHSICALSPMELSKTLNKLCSEGMKYCHLDFMDFHYTKTFGLHVDFCKNLINEFPEITFDAHLMVEKPYEVARKVAELNIKYIFIPAKQYNKAEFDSLVVDFPNINFGLQLEKEDQVNDFKEVIKSTNCLLIMTINVIGGTGQSLNPELLLKGKQAKQINPKIKVFSDGGLRAENVDQFIENDFDVIVGGSIVNKFANENFIQWFEKGRKHV